jgi:hypothetical protein
VRDHPSVQHTGEVAVADGATMRGNFEAPSMRTLVPMRRVDCALYEIDPKTGVTIEIFYTDALTAPSYGSRRAGWYWRERGSPGVESGPFVVCLDAYRDAMRSM